MSTFMNHTVESIKVCGPQRAGLSDEPTGVVADGGGSAIDEAEDAVG